MRVRARALPRIDLNDRRVQYTLGGIAVGGIVVALILAIGSGQFVLAALFAAVAAAPALILAAYRWPYVFPYGLYIVLVPFDNLLSIGAGTSRAISPSPPSPRSACTSSRVGESRRPRSRSTSGWASWSGC